jgi:hypothetical protein
LSIGTDQHCWDFPGTRCCNWCNSEAVIHRNFNKTMYTVSNNQENIVTVKPRRRMHSNLGSMLGLTNKFVYANKSRASESRDARADSSRPCGVLGDYRHARKNVKALKEIAETPCWRCFLFRNCGWEMSTSLGPLPPPAGAREPVERSCDPGHLNRQCQALLELACSYWPALAHVARD